MNEIICLVRRDLHLLKNTSLKRAALYVASVLLPDIFLLLTGSEGLFRRSIYGVTAEFFRQEPGLFPYQWLWLQLGAVMTAFDFVREDLYLHSSNVIVKLSHRSSYWISKLISGAVYCLTAAAFCVAEKTAMLRFFTAGGYCDSGTGEVDVVRFASALFVCIYLMFCMYSLFSLILPDIVSFLIVISGLCAGLPSGSGIFLINHVMLCRNDVTGGLLCIAVIYAVCLLAGSLLLKWKDIITFER